MSWFKTIIKKRIFKKADEEDGRPLLPFRPIGKPEQQPIIPGQFEEPETTEQTEQIEQPEQVEPLQQVEVEDIPQEELEGEELEDLDQPFVEQEPGQPSFKAHKKLLTVNPDLKNSFEIIFIDDVDFNRKIKPIVDNINKYNNGIANRQGWDPIQLIYQPDLDSPPYQKELKDAQGNPIIFNARRLTVVGEPPVPAGTALKTLKDPETRKLIKDKNGENITIPVRYKVIGLVKHQALRPPAEIQLDENTQQPYLINLPEEIQQKYTNQSINPKSAKWKLGVDARTAVTIPNIEAGQRILQQNKLEKDKGVWRNFVYADPRSPKIKDPFW
ncbi:hypothetical protein LCGC14_2845520, partial [marine sediment metagenome]